jgi:hypothetical protein
MPPAKIKQKKLYKVSGTSYAFAQKRDAQVVCNKLNKIGGKKNRVIAVHRWVNIK